MHEFLDGKFIEMTPERIKEREEALQNEESVPPTLTMEDRMIRVEQEVEDLSYVITGEVKNDAQR